MEGIVAEENQEGGSDGTGGCLFSGAASLKSSCLWAKTVAFSLLPE